MPGNRIANRLLAASAVWLLTLCLSTISSPARAEELAHGTKATPADEKTSEPADRVAAALRFLDLITDTVNASNREHSASPHEPPGKPDDRPPGHANNDKDKEPKEGPPGKPDDRPPGHANNDKDKDKGRDKDKDKDKDKGKD
jgi:hypothetical protein